MWARKILSVASAVALAVLATQASAGQRFGARLDINTQPSNAGTGQFCRNAVPFLVCSWVLMDAFQREFPPGTNGHLAPKNGTLVRIRLISCAAGTFVLQIARNVNPTTKQARVVRSGPLINYGPDTENCEGETYRIQTFNVNVPVLKNDYLAVAASKVGFVRCSSGGANTLLWGFPLVDGGALRTATGQQGCWLLLEAEYSN